MVVAASTDMGGVNELLSATGSFTQSVLQLMFLQLLQEQPDFDQHSPTFAPELAERWEWSADGKVLTLFLRQDVRWTNGVPVTAARKDLRDAPIKSGSLKRFRSTSRLASNA